MLEMLQLITRTLLKCHLVLKRIVGFQGQDGGMLRDITLSYSEDD
jgi:hypothetical protein